MAAPVKMGLAYFPFSTALFDDLKLIDVQLKYGPVGEVIYLRLLCLIYENGYYLEADLDVVAAKIIKSIGSRWVSNKKLVVQVIHSLADAGLIDKDLLAKGVLTSGSIQKRWLEALKRRRVQIDKYNLIDVVEKKNDREALESAPTPPNSCNNNPSNCNNNPSSCNNNPPIKKSKEKKSKEESKHAHGQHNNVLLTNDEYKKLTERFTDYAERIDYFSNRLEIKGYKYKSHYLAILEWAKKDKEANKSAERSYDTKDIERQRDVIGKITRRQEEA